LNPKGSLFTVFVYAVSSHGSSQSSRFIEAPVNPSSPLKEEWQFIQGTNSCISMRLPSDPVPSQMLLLFKPPIAFNKAKFLGRGNISLHLQRYLGKEGKKERQIHPFPGL